MARPGRCPDRRVVMRCLAVLTVRNEAAFLLDWLAHHSACGFTDFLIFSNDCTDGTDRMLDRLMALGLVTHVRNDGPHDKGGIQFTALKQADRMDIVKSADWILPLDVDEYVNIHVGDRTLAALIATLPDATAITLTWRLFGNAGQVAYKDDPVTRTFTRAAPVTMYWPWRAAMFKTLYRNDGTYGKLGVHRPRNPDKARVDAAQWYDGEGRTLDAQFRTRRIFSNYGRSNYALVQLNHYALGAMQSYVLKADRGRAVHADQMLGIDYWVERNFNTDRDETILALAPAADRLKAQWMRDADLAQLQADAVAWRQARFDALMREEPFRALYGRLLMTPASRPLTFPEARSLLRHAGSARSAPQADP